MFDPYHKWLGIPPGSQPPTHYQLLGISAGESDKSVIEAAVIRQTSFIRNFQAGEHGEDANRILTEIAAARICLLDSQKRAEYDRKLKPSSSDPAPEPPQETVAQEPRKQRSPKPVSPAPPPIETIPIAQQQPKRTPPQTPITVRAENDPEPAPVRLVSERKPKPKPVKKIRRSERDTSYHTLIIGVSAALVLILSIVIIFRKSTKGLPTAYSGSSEKATSTVQPAEKMAAEALKKSEEKQVDEQKAVPEKIQIANLAALGAAQSSGTFAGEPPRLLRAGGVVISSDGYFLTCAHIFTSDRRIVVTVDGNQYRAAIMAIDPELDLALLKMENAKGLVSIPLAKDGETESSGESKIFSYGPGRRPLFGDHVGTAKLADAKGRIYFTEPIPWASIGGIAVDSRGAIVGAIAARNNNNGEPVAAQISLAQINGFLEKQSDLAEKISDVAIPSQAEVAETVARAVGRVDQRSDRKYPTIAEKCRILLTDIEAQKIMLQTEEHNQDIIDEALLLFKKRHSMEDKAALSYLQNCLPEYRRKDVLAKIETYRTSGAWSYYFLQNYARYENRQGFDLAHKWFEDPNLARFSSPIHAMGASRDPRALPILAKLYDNFEHKGAVGQAYIAFGPAAEEAVLEKLKTARPGNRDQLYMALEYIGGKKTLEYIQQSTSSQNPSRNNGSDSSIRSIAVSMIKRRLERMEKDPDALDFMHFGDTN